MKNRLPGKWVDWWQGLSTRDRRTLKYGALFLIIYLPVFSGVKVFKGMEESRREHQLALADLETLKSRFRTYETKLLEIEKLRKQTGIQVDQLDRATVVGLASTALQEKAKSSQLTLGPIRENKGGSQGGVVSTMQLEAFGPIAGLLSFVDGIRSSGFPVIVDDVRMDPFPGKPGVIKLNLSLLILDYTTWKPLTRGRRA